MQGLLFHQDISTDDLDLLPGAMLNPNARNGHPTRGPACSWCGIRPEDIRPDGYVMTWNGRTDAAWKDPDSITSWACDVGVRRSERICPFCVHKPTDLQRAIEVARLVAQAKEAA